VPSTKLRDPILKEIQSYLLADVGITAQRFNRMNRKLIEADDLFTKTKGATDADSNQGSPTGPSGSEEPVGHQPAPGAGVAVSGSGPVAGAPAPAGAPARRK
jgi:hypothetical protein